MAQRGPSDTTAVGTHQLYAWVVMSETRRYRVAVLTDYHLLRDCRSPA